MNAVVVDIFCSALLKGLSTSIQTYWQLYCGFEKPHSFLAHNSKKRKMNNIKRDIFFKILQIINICEKSCERKPSNFTMACFLAHMVVSLCDHRHHRHL